MLLKSKNHLHESFGTYFLMKGKSKNRYGRLSWTKITNENHKVNILNNNLLYKHRKSLRDYKVLLINIGSYIVVNSCESINNKMTIPDV